MSEKCFEIVKNCNSVSLSFFCFGQQNVLLFHHLFVRGYRHIDQYSIFVQDRAKRDTLFIRLLRFREH